jgi:uncharacterized membrane protein YdjX (TVP38/TMEM64 family)
MSDWLLVIGTIFGVNLLPAFGPPTWALLVFFSLNSDLPAVPLVLVGALAASSGRFVLATTVRHFRGRFSAKRRQNLEAAEGVLVGSRAKATAGVGLFALSPVPSAQLFVAAGLLTVPLLPLTAAFFAGRLVSYTLYVTAASAAKGSLGAVLGDFIGSPLGIAVQLAMLAGLVALVRLDWAALLARKRPGHSARNPAACDADAPTTARAARRPSPLRG